VDGAQQEAADVLEGRRSRDLLAELSYSLDEDNYSGVTANSLGASYIAREQRLSRLEDSSYIYVTIILVHISIIVNVLIIILVDIIILVHIRIILELLFKYNTSSY
jgi:hypothetical protein